MTQQIKRLYRNFAEGASEQHIPELFKMWRDGVIVPAARWSRLRLSQHCKARFDLNAAPLFDTGVEILEAVSALDAYTEALCEPEAQRFDLNGQPAEPVTLHDALRARSRAGQTDPTPLEKQEAKYQHDLTYWRILRGDSKLNDLVNDLGTMWDKPKRRDYPLLKEAMEEETIKEEEKE